MKNISIFLIFSAFILSCATKTSNKPEELLLGNWYGGRGIKYSVINGKKKWVQNLPASHTLFVYGRDHIFIHEARGDRSVYEVKGNRIYGDIDKPDQKRYYIIKKLNNQTLTVVGPYKNEGELFVPDILYSLNYYRKK